MIDFFFSKLLGIDKKMVVYIRIIWLCVWSSNDEYFFIVLRDKKVKYLIFFISNFLFLWVREVF